MDLFWDAVFLHSREELKSCGSSPTACRDQQHLIPPTDLLKLWNSCPIRGPGPASWAIESSGVPWPAAGLFPTGRFVGVWALRGLSVVS